MSSTGNKNASLARITVVIGIAVAGLFASLFGLISVGMSATSFDGEWQKSPMQVSDEQALAKRIKELPEVQTFLQIYPNATAEKDYNSGSAARYSFGYAKPYPFLEKGIGLGVSLSASLTKIPDQESIQTGEQKPFGEYYYSVTFHCGPASLADPDRGWFPDRIRQKIAEPCESEIREINDAMIK